MRYENNTLINTRDTYFFFIFPKALFLRIYISFFYYLLHNSGNIHNIFNTIHEIWGNLSI